MEPIFQPNILQQVAGTLGQVAGTVEHAAGTVWGVLGHLGLPFVGPQGSTGGTSRSCLWEGCDATSGHVCVRAYVCVCLYAFVYVYVHVDVNRRLQGQERQCKT